MYQLIEWIKVQAAKIDSYQLRTQVLNGIKTDKFSLLQTLNHYNTARPLILALKAHGAKHLVKLFSEADHEVLEAFIQVIDKDYLITLAQFFLIKTNEALETVSRPVLIEILQQPDLAGQLARALKTAESNATSLMVDGFLMSATETLENEQKRFPRLKQFLLNYPFEISAEALFLLHNLSAPRNSSTADSNAYIEILNLALSRMKLSQQKIFFKQLDEPNLLFLTDLCLQAIASENLEQGKQLLLFIVTQSKYLDAKSQDSLRKRLNKLDNYLFDNSQIPSTPANKSALESLLNSPRWIAGASLGELQRLSTRFAFASSMDLRSSTKITASTERPLRTKLFNTQRYLHDLALDHALPGKALQNKKLCLTHYSMQANVEELLTQLEEHCAGDTTYGEQALIKLYNFYHTQQNRFRVDLLYRAINLAYKTPQKIGNSENIILSWAKQYAPELGIDDSFLQRKSHQWVYNSAQKKIGFLNQANQVICFVEGEPVSLVDANSQFIDRSLYTDSNQVLGRLDAHGQLKTADPVTQNLSAFLLAKVPPADLQASSLGLKLLIEHVLFENTLSVLYQNLPTNNGDFQQAWCERQLVNYIEQTPDELRLETMDSITKYLGEDSLFYLLANCKCKKNATLLFYALLDDEKRRSLLLNGAKAADFQQFLKRHDVATTLMNYLAYSYDKPWFVEGLRQFAHYVNKEKLPNVLSNALKQFADYAKNKPHAQLAMNMSLQVLSSGEETTTLILRDFVKVPLKGEIVKEENSELAAVMSYFNADHLIHSIKILNRSSNWLENSLYRFVLLLLTYQHNTLFASSTSWSTEALNELGIFISRYLAKERRPSDPKHFIGHRLLGELIFRGAQVGQTNLFYFQKEFNQQASRLSISKDFLYFLWDKFYISDGIRELFPKGKNIFAPTGTWPQELQNNRVLVDWGFLFEDTWKEDEQKKLPLLCIYLMNYQGPKAPLLKLLADYFNCFQPIAEYLHPVSKLMIQFPNREMSAVIFDALEAAVIKDPELLDKTLLSHMAYYYAKKLAPPSKNREESELELLTYFGQNKHYSLVHKACEILAKTCMDPLKRKRLEKAGLEAKVEMALQSHQGYFYFGLVKFVQRLWHYGFNAIAKTSQIVKYCDDQTEGPAHKLAGTPVKISDNLKKSTVYSFAEKKKLLINLLIQVNKAQISVPETPPAKSAVVYPAHFLFNETDVSHNNNGILVLQPLLGENKHA